MLYSLVIVQPRAAQFLATDDDALEAFLAILGAGNRRPVLAIISGLVASGALLPLARLASSAQDVLYAVEGALLLLAAAVFVRVSWRLWPARVFALPEERPQHRDVLHRHALAMVALVGSAFVVAVINLAHH